MAELKANTYWITVSGSGTGECDGLYCPSTAPPTVSESGTKSSLGYWNGKMAVCVQLDAIQCVSKSMVGVHGVLLLTCLYYTFIISDIIYHG